MKSGVVDFIDCSSELLLLTWHNPESPEGILAVGLPRSGCGHVCEELSQFMIDMGGLSPLWVASSPRQVSLGCLGKLVEHKTMRKPENCASPRLLLEFLSGVPQWWLVTWKCKLKQILCSLKLLLPWCSSQKKKKKQARMGIERSERSWIINGIRRIAGLESNHKWNGTLCVLVATE